MESIPYDKRSGKIWFNGKTVEWKDAKYDAWHRWKTSFYASFDGGSSNFRGFDLRCSCCSCGIDIQILEDSNRSSSWLLYLSAP